MDKVQALLRLRAELREQHKHLNSRRVKIGDFTYGQPLILTWGEDTKLTIGKFCSIGANVQIYLGGNHHTDWLTTYPFNALPQLRGCWDYIDDGHAATKGDITIGNDVWIGNNVMIMSGVTIGDGAVIAAGSVVTDDVTSSSLVGGSPAKQKKILWQKVPAVGMRWWDWPIEKLAEAVPRLMQGMNFNLAEFDMSWEAEHGEPKQKL